MNRKKLLLEKLKKENCILLTTYDADVTHKNRKNSRKVKVCENTICEYNLSYRKFVETLKNREPKTYFLIVKEDTENYNNFITYFFEEFKYGREEPLDWEKLSNLETFIPYTKEQLESCKEIYIDNPAVMPEIIGNWKFDHGYGDTISYYCGNKHAIIYENKIIIGTCVPVGCTLLKQDISSFENAEEILMNFYR